MKKVLLSVFSFCLLTIGLQAQSTFYSESFEDTLGWKLSNQFDDGYEDYSLRDSTPRKSHSKKRKESGTSPLKMMVGNTNHLLTGKLGLKKKPRRLPKQLLLPLLQLAWKEK